MKAVLLLGLVLLVATVFARPEDKKYTDKFDNIDIEQIIKSDRLMKNYVNCLMDRGHCGPDGATLKEKLPDALKTNCESCTEKQKENSRKIIHHLIDNKRDWWNELEAKYDPDGGYRIKYEKNAKDEGLKL